MKKIIVVRAFAVVAFLAASIVSAQNKSCECIGGEKCIEVAPGVVECSPSIECEAQFDGNIPQSGPINSVVTPSAITASVNIPTLGDITFELDATRPAPPTTLVSDDPNTRFPLDVDINFNATATIAAQFRGEDGEDDPVYENVQPLHYSGSDINSVNPFDGERVTLTDDVQFVERGDPTGRVVFTLKAGQSTLLLGVLNPPAPEPIQTCFCRGGLKCLETTFPDGSITVECAPDPSCDGLFSGADIPAAGKLQLTLTAVSFNGSANIPSLGIVNLSLDPTRTATSTISSNKEFARFPATVSINFYVTATAESEPGVVYQSEQPFNYYTDNATSVNPFDNESFVLTNDVKFVRQPVEGEGERGGVTSFTVKAGTSVITLGR